MLQSSARTAREAAVQTARYQQAAKAAQATAQKASQAAGRALRAILSAARSLAAAMMAGGSTVLSMVLVICLIGLLIASPFGIFFSGEDSGTGYTMPEAVTMLNTEFTDRIEQIKVENSHDELDMDNAGSAAMVANWRDVLAVYAVRTTTDTSSPDEVATLTEEKLDILRQIFWDMNEISYWLETISGGEDEEDILTQMQALAKTLPEYSLVREMPCIGDTLAPRLIAEIGDVRRFHSKRALIAYAGIDAPPYQSGKFCANNRHISKRGNRYLRKTGYEVMQSYVMHKPANDPIFTFIEKKRGEGKSGKLAMVAGLNKFLRVYYGKVTELYRSLPAIE